MRCSPVTDWATEARTGRTLRQLITYGLVGAAINIWAYLTYLLITALGMEPKAAMSILYVTVATATFFGNKRVTFRHHGGTVQAGARYALGHFSGYLLNLLLLLIFVDVFGCPHQWVQGAAFFVVGFYLFLVFKFLVFRDTRLQCGS